MRQAADLPDDCIGLLARLCVGNQEQSFRRKILHQRLNLLLRDEENQILARRLNALKLRNVVQCRGLTGHLRPLDGAQFGNGK